MLVVRFAFPDRVRCRNVALMGVLVSLPPRPHDLERKKKKKITFCVLFLLGHI